MKDEVTREGAPRRKGQAAVLRPDWLQLQFHVTIAGKHLERFRPD